MEKFINQYSISKTLRFELRPQGKTQEYFEQAKILERDIKRSDDYREAKQIIDKYHKFYMEQKLSNAQLDKEQLHALKTLLTSSDSDVKKIATQQERLRKYVVKILEEKPKEGENIAVFKDIFKKELIQEILPKWEELNEKERSIIEGFNKFTTYFTGFHENRKNIYTSEEKSTSIAYRLIHDNFPKFLDNIRAYEKICKDYPELARQLTQHAGDDFFQLEYYNQCLSQYGIEHYNVVIDGFTTGTEKQKQQGLNEYINQYKHQTGDKRIPSFKPLFKQILSDRVSLSFLLDAFECDKDLASAVCTTYLRLQQDKILEKLQKLLQQLATNYQGGCYVNHQLFSRLSQELTGDWGYIYRALGHMYDSQYLPKTKKITKKYEKEREKFTKQDISLKQLQDALDIYGKQLDDAPDYPKLEIYFAQQFSQAYSQVQNHFTALQADADFQQASNDKKFLQNKDLTEKIKEFLDALKVLIKSIKPLDCAHSERDVVFYNDFDTCYSELCTINRLYDQCRNYLTQKPYSTEKIKLNFDNAQLLNGWSVNKEKNYLNFLLEKDGLFYLAILPKNQGKLLKELDENSTGEHYQKMIYDYIPGPNKMFPKVFFSKKNADLFNVPAEIKRINTQKSYTKGSEHFSKDDLHQLIDFFKTSIEKHPEWKKFGFQFSPTQSYDDISQFYQEVAHQAYKVDFKPISKAQIDTLVEEGKLYLFQIYNKDFSPHSTGRPNLHTLYWRALFEPQNLADICYKLSGEAEIFYRQKSLFYDEHIMKYGHHYDDEKNLKDRLTYPIIKDKRYTVDKFLFHVPIELNFKAQGNNNINPQVLDYLKGNPDVKIIGIDRGERHLLYISLINQQGEILEQRSLNILSGESKNNKQHNYMEKLAEKERKRKEARVSWQAIDNIKDVKAGYLSQVVHIIAQMMVEHNAIVVLEDLNMGFKRGRQKVERQIYQKFEKMLIEKLNYLVFKTKKDDEIGGIYNALQLSNKFIRFQRMGKQNGFLFYLQPSYTSKIDPATGFVNFFNFKYRNAKDTAEFIGKFQQIRYNPQKDYFEFHFDYQDFTETKGKTEGTKTAWIACSHGDERIGYNSREKKSEKIHVTNALKKLLKENNVIYQDGFDIRQYLPSAVDKKNVKFYKQFLRLMQLTFQLRHSLSGTDMDFIMSPVSNASGEFYHSDNYGEHSSIPCDADANGAYHIALKGLMMLEHVHEAWDGQFKSVKLDKPLREWLQFAQSRHK